MSVYGYRRRMRLPALGGSGTPGLRNKLWQDLSRSTLQREGHDVIDIGRVRIDLDGERTGIPRQRLQERGGLYKR